MRFSIRSKMGILVSLLSILTIVSAFLLSGVFSHGTATHAAATVVQSATKGTLAPVATVDPLKLPITTSSGSPSTPFSKGVRPIPRTGTASSTGNIPSAASSLVDGQPAGQLLENFNGVSSLDSEKTNFGAEFEPPDQGLCAGNGFVVEPVNSAFTIYRSNGSVVAGPFNVNLLYAEGPRQFTSDPRCYYDRSTHTWFAIILFISLSNTHARTDIAVNTSGDPTKPWTVYHLDGTDDGSNGTPSHAGCPCFGDQPLLGIDAQNIYISANEFSILGPQFNGAQIYALSKAQLVALSKSVDFVQFQDLAIAGTLAASVQPAITNGSANAEYFLNALDPFGTFDDRLGVWALTNGGLVSQGGVPTLSSVVISSEPYAIPPGAQQKGAKSHLDAGDDRMQQVQYIDGHLWGALDSAVNIPNDTTARAGAAWFEVQPSLKGNNIGSATVDNQGYIASLGNYLLYPAIQVSNQGTAAIVMTLSGHKYFASAVYTVLQVGQSSFGAIHIAAAGTGPYDPKATRWGDYSWAVYDPDQNSFWLATEYIPPVSSQTTDGLVNWGTRVLEVSAGS